MRLGVDAHLLSRPSTGISRYIAELTKELVTMPGELFLYSGAIFPAEQWRQDNVATRRANYHSRGSSMLWSQTSLPNWAAKDHVDVFWGPSHRLPRYLPAQIARVVTIHDLVWKHAGDTMRPLSRWVEKRLMPQAIRQADRIVASSVSTAKAIEAEYPAVSDRIRVVYPGTTDLPTPLDYQSLSALGIDSPYFLFVGTLEPRKNLKRLLEAYSLLDINTRNRVRFVIAGGKGWGRVDLVDTVKKLGIEGHVVLTGYVNETQLATLYAHARFLAMPSIYEGFGLPLIEAMSFGVPVLTSDRSSMPEVAGDAGVLVDPFNVHHIARGLFFLICDDLYHDHLASMAIRNARRFTWQNAARDIWTVFEEAAAARVQLIRGSKK